ncbi:uncharacterized protein LOC144671611 isoform X1 [Cetorhinus maximus]
MGSSQMKLRLVLFTLTLLLSLQLSHFFSLSKVDSAVGSLTIEKSVDSPDTTRYPPPPSLGHCGCSVDHLLDTQGSPQGFTTDGRESWTHEPTSSFYTGSWSSGPSLCTSLLSNRTEVGENPFGIPLSRALC